jgi:hypothetical protein
MSDVTISVLVREKIVEAKNNYGMVFSFNSMSCDIGRIMY